MTSQFEPFREPVRTTLVRTLSIAVVIGAALARPWAAGGLARWPAATLLALWPSLGGHFVELLFLNGIRPQIGRSRATQIVVRIAMWFVGGMLFAMLMRLTATKLLHNSSVGWLATHHSIARVALVGGAGFIVVELIAHLALQLRGAPSFYNGRG